MIEEGVVFVPVGFISSYMTISGIPVFFTLAGDVAPFRTLFGVPVIFTVLGDGFDAYPLHTTDSIFILAAHILAVNDSIKSDSRAVNGVLR